jgi:putative FmdB family regulatory protein
MPIYEYGCESCGHQLEVQQRFSDAPLKTCPACGKDALEKLISAAAFHLKGGGWYRDGYGSGQGSSKSGRTENQRADRLTKAINDDKKKSDGGSGSGSGPGSGSSSGSSSGGSGSSASSAAA